MNNKFINAKRCMLDQHKNDINILRRKLEIFNKIKFKQIDIFFIQNYHSSHLQKTPFLVLGMLRELIKAQFGETIVYQAEINVWRYQFDTYFLNI